MTFHARHRVYRSVWNEVENLERFGWTSREEGHGHLYQVDVVVAGELDPKTGLLLDLNLLDSVLTAEVVEPLSGRSLNEAVDLFKSGEVVATCEALAGWLWLRLESRLPSAITLDLVRVAEDDTLWAECTGPA